MDDRQLDLFAPTPATPARGASGPAGRPALDPAALTDAALVAALSTAGLRDCVGLAGEAGRRGLGSAVPALALLCRRFAGWGLDAPVPEQIAAIEALTRIGGRAAAAAIADGIGRSAFIGPTLAAAVAAAAALGASLPDDISLRLLRHGDPQLRADACRCVRNSPAVTALLVDLLDDLHPAVAISAACALGRFGRAEARPVLQRLLREAPTADIVAAIAGVADEECLVLLGRLARLVPALAPAALDALEASENPRAAAIAATLAPGAR